MKKQLTITTNTEQLSLLRFQNSCLEDYLKTSPKDVNLDFVVDYLSKADIGFIGDKAYREYVSLNTLLKVKSPKGPVIRSGSKIVSLNDDKIVGQGIVSSGVFSAYLQENIALVKFKGEVGMNTYVNIRGHDINVDIITDSFI